MSLPPDTIQVKRKRGVEDGPVDFLRVEANKRHRSLSGDGTWVYQRKQVDPEQELTKHTNASAIPSILPTKEGDENRPLKPLRRTQAAKKPQEQLQPPDLNLPEPNSDLMRRFHLSRSIAPNPAITGAGIAKKRAATAVFVERSTKKPQEARNILSLPQRPKAGGPQDRHPPTHATPVPTVKVSPAASSEPAVAAQDHQHQQPSSQSRLKRPGSNARTKSSSPAPGAPGTRAALPLSFTSRDREEFNMDQLARDMDAYALSQIFNNVSRMDQDSAKIAARSQAHTNAALNTSPASKSRFKPKAPALRYHERHPEQVVEAERAKAAAAAVAAQQHDADMMDIDDEDGTDDEDYVVETYERVPASRLRDQVVPPHRVGLLVFDSEPDRADFFYGEEGDSDDEYLEDDEDENAENYYTADYPEEEVDWDDEFDRNPYLFQTKNASDEEEYDESGFLDDVWNKSGGGGGGGSKTGVPF
ncbi:hypothetical protein B0T17DRAFT_491499 [Bombardia bombarda]|uniref:Transcription factor Iwr1 domain-containing protein n=1 Tax=Bombardia bombarda TaxID=252184 RepID=A0AA39XC88_9PEZI|nr:hypothetical protein B0T17DRAFT_491499 [Bombardia bombarda]